MALAKLPRLVIAGLAGDTGKSLVSLGLIGALRRCDLRVAPFKKGPDFIDAAWLGAQAGVACRNLDTYLMPEEAILASLLAGSRGAGMAVVEGNRGLFDGVDAQGSHSTAELAKLIGAPVVLVVDVTKSTRTVAAQVLGCSALDPELQLSGVILNRVGTARQEAVIREALAADTGLPVVGAIPRLTDQHLPSRHLGLVTAMEHPAAADALAKVTEVVAEYTDVSALIEVAGRAAGLPGAPEEMGVAPVVKMNEVGSGQVTGAAPHLEGEVPAWRETRPRVRIGVLRDEAFSFYYPENLASLESAGAELCSISPIADEELPAIDALYAGGGFPEVHAARLTANRPLRAALAHQVGQGLPVWAECGGLMYLARTLVKDGVEYPMVGALPVVVEHTPRPQGHGYVEARADRANPFIEKGADLRGHEFHYSRLRDDGGRVATVFKLERGVGVGGGRDGIQVANVVAAYMHLHALATPAWAGGLLSAATGGTVGAP